MSDNEEQHDARAHKGLLQAISNLSKTQHIRQATRNEAQIEQDEFRLIKTTTKKVLEAPIETTYQSGSHAVKINDIVEVLKATDNHLATGKLLRKVQSTKQVLPRPLEKPAAERIKRSIGYENVKNKLKRWDAIVAKNRSAETKIFPLQPAETIYINTSAHSKPLKLSVKSDLMNEMAQTDMKLKQLLKQRAGDNVDDKELAKREKQLLQGKLTREELIARRKELAYLKMRQSQASAKARLQNKIKSKKYHKLLKRQKMLEQVKQFELLQKTNPEAALERLNELERSRVQERASLRHKNTGTWAKNLQMRAKYDKDVRKDLAEQLQISRELTQKKQDDADIMEEQTEESNEQNAEEHEDETETDPFNPWTKSSLRAKNAKDQQQHDKSWRKYWLERIENEKLLKQYQETPAESQDVEKEEEEAKPAETETKSKVVPAAAKQRTERKQRRASKRKAVYENGWLVEELDPENVVNIDDIFDTRENKIAKVLSRKLKRLSKEATQLKQRAKLVKPKMRPEGRSNSPTKNLDALSFKKTTNQRPKIDEELGAEDDLPQQSTLIAESKETQQQKTRKEPEPEADTIDPNKLASVRLQEHLRDLPEFNADMDAEAIVDEEDDEENQQMTISQAFEDDDIVADFGQEKAQDSKLKDAEISLSLPGWGSWAGAGISKEAQEARNKRRQQRLLLKLAPEEKRADANKQRVYINEASTKELRAHLVADLPFPFTCVEDYEASIRAPIGRNFVTETAFRMLTRPAVITRKGQVIEPMDESELVKPPRRLRNVVDKRIEAFNKANKKESNNLKEPRPGHKDGRKTGRKDIRTDSV